MRSTINKTPLFLLTAGLVIFLFQACKNDPADEDHDTRGIVKEYGHLDYNGMFLMSEKGDTVRLEGMSMFWHQWGSKFFNPECLRWLRDDWHCDIVRIPIGVNGEGFMDDPDSTKKLIFNAIEACIDLDIYVIVDWHSHEAEKATGLAVDFYREVAERWGDKPHIIYEIYNEPLKCSWSEDVKPYLDTVIETIRNIDPDNIIVVGSPHWSQDVDVAATDPVKGENIAYALHYYAGTHKQWLRDKAMVAIDSGLPLWVTEFGMCNADGNGPVDYEESEAWFEFMEKYRISWCKWTINDKEETASALIPGADSTGGWGEKDLTESGKYIRNKLRELNP